MKKVVFNIITFLCIAACSSNKEQDNLITIHLDPTSRQTVNWEQLFDTASMQVIPLETIDQSLLAWVDKVIITDTVYSFSSNNSIYTFNQNGNFLFKIAHQGRGPGEYLVLDDFYIDEDNHYYILDNNSFKIIEYSSKGEFINEINTLVNNGFKEIVLTGIHTGSYPELVKLIQEISKNDKLERIRISSIEATEINDEFLKELKNNNKICNHMHIPVQAACDNTLKKMNRKYDMNKFKEIINKIREVRPDINITTDLIVGFPTETKEDFLESYNNAKEIKFGKIHVFPYSKRDGTVASKMKSIVTDTEKKERTHKMITLSNKLENEYYNKFIDKTLSVLVEEVFDKYCTGHTDNYIKVIINKKLEHNKFYNVKIIKVDNCNVYGEVE